MKIYFAPLEGITGYVFRNAYNDAFHPQIDKYFSPFISPGINQPLTPKELRDIHPDNNKGMYLVPQILANNAKDFLLAAKHIKELGYNEVNLNLGCPSGTVVSKKKGAGLLSEPDMLERMLDEICNTTDMKVSVKTRIGKENSEEFPRLLEIFNKFSLEELIIHPRVRSDFYNNTPNMKCFQMAVEESRNKLCYNGDVITGEDFESIHKTYPSLEAVMIGRGLLRNPMLADEITADKKPDKDAILKFHNLLMEGYIEIMSGERPVLFKMKELWNYMIDLFEDSDKLGKKIRKAEKLKVYKEAVDEVFEKCEVKK